MQKPVNKSFVALALSLLTLSTMSGAVLNCAEARSHGKLAEHDPSSLVALGVVPTVRGIPGIGGRVGAYRTSQSGRRIIRGASSPLVRHHRAVEQAPVVKPVVPAAVKPAAVAKVVVKGGALKTIVSRTIEQGVTYKVLTGALPSGSRVRINLVDIDMSRSQVKIRAVSGNGAFARLKDVREHSRDSGALAAINANYFKTNGNPLGTLIQDGDWMAGPLYERVSLGFTAGGYARIARVAVHGTLYTDNPEHPALWINNVNQPRRTGSHCILYTRHWGNQVTLPYDGVLVGVDASGKVVDFDSKKMTIPYGGFVLADSKDTPIGDLKSGEQVNIKWQITPGDWDNVTEAVSGGPLLLKEGKPVFDLKAEKFPQAFAGNHVHARTACGITAQDHLLMATFEGAHTLYDVGKFLKAQGCTEALNLDGGGSTTMVVDGKTVTANATASQRRVAVALGVFTEQKAQSLTRTTGSNFKPSGDISSFIGSGSLPFKGAYNQALQVDDSDPLMTHLIARELKQQNKALVDASAVTTEQIAAEQERTRMQSPPDSTLSSPNVEQQTGDSGKSLDVVGSK